jgi:signal transduction histidine kinase
VDCNPSGDAPVHLIVAAELGGRAAVTFVERDDRGAARAVFGFDADAHEAANALFGRATVDPNIADTTRGMVKLDSLSIQIRTADAIVLYGHADPERTIRAILHPRGPLEGLSINVSLRVEQIAPSLLNIVPTHALWHLGFLQFSTVLMIALAIGASRREVLLARARSDFIAGVSHDLRMPLAQILIAGETMTLQRERDETQRLALAASIVREARRLVTLVENVLLFSRSGAVELHPRLESVAVGALFADVIEAVQLAVDDARQTIAVREGAELAVLGDRPLLRQALVNLVDNALKYGSAGQRVHLGATVFSATRVRIAVEDEGPGIPLPQRARVFEAYERLSRDQTSERTGTGLGLAVVSNIARACGGKVWLEDAPAGGTRAVIELDGAAATTTAARAMETA